MVRGPVIQMNKPEQPESDNGKTMSSRATASSEEYDSYSEQDPMMSAENNESGRKVILIVITELKRCYIPVFLYTGHRFGDPESNNGKTCGSENAHSPTENVYSAEQEPLISAVKTDDIPLMSGSMTDRQCFLKQGLLY